MFDKQTIRTVDVKGKRVLVRVDINVPVKDGKVTSDARIAASMPTVEHCMKAGAKVMVMSHRGRPEEGSEVLDQRPRQDLAAVQEQQPRPAVAAAVGPEDRAAVDPIRDPRRGIARTVGEDRRPEDLAAELATLREWLMFDWEAGWGTDDFELEVDDGQANPGSRQTDTVTVKINRAPQITSTIDPAFGSISTTCRGSTAKRRSPCTARPVGLLTPVSQSGSTRVPSSETRAIDWRPAPRLGL